MRGDDRLLSSQKLAEYFVSAEVIAEFLLITRRQVPEMAPLGLQWQDIDYTDQQIGLRISEAVTAMSNVKVFSNSGSS